MERIVHIVSDPGDGDVANELVEYLENANFVVHHNGAVSVGDSIIARAMDYLNIGKPVIICATSRSLSRKWTHQLANSANTMPHSRVFVIQMEEDLYVDQLSLNTVPAAYWKDPQVALNDLCKALNRCYPQTEPLALDYQDFVQSADYLDTLTGLTIFDMHALDKFRRQLRDDVIERLPATLSPWQFLQQADFMRNEQLTCVGALLFAENPTKILPIAIVQCVRYYGTTKDVSREKIDIVGTVPRQISKAWEFVAKHVRQGESPTSRGPYAEASYRYPMVAVREIIVNALVHRDYTESKACVHIHIFEDRIEVGSPGAWTGRTLGPEGTQSMTMLTGESHRRNFRLASAMSWIRLFEGDGSGIPTAVRDCQEVDAPAPLVKQVGSFVTVVVQPRHQEEQHIDVGGEKAGTTSSSKCWRRPKSATKAQQ